MLTLVATSYLIGTHQAEIFHESDSNLEKNQIN